LIRASETARIVSEALGVAGETDARLGAEHAGQVAVVHLHEARVRFAGMFASRRELAPFQRFPGGETPVEFRARIEQFLSELLDTTPDGHRVLLVSHGGAIAMLFRAFLRLPVNTITDLTTGDTGVHCWQLDGDRRLIRFANALSHLEGLPAG